MELLKVEVDTVKLLGKDSITLGSQARIQIRTQEQGEETIYVLDETVPAGKTWSIVVRLGGEETDA